MEVTYSKSALRVLVFKTLMLTPYSICGGETATIRKDYQPRETNSMSDTQL